MRLCVIAKLAEQVDDAVVLVRHELVVQQVIRFVRQLEQARVLLVDERDPRQEVVREFVFHGMSLPFVVAFILVLFCRIV